LKVRPAATAKAPTATATPTLTPNGAASEGKTAAGPTVVDLGQARVHVTYAQRNAHADLAFRSTAGGTLRVDAGANLDLSFPQVTRGLVVKRLPVHGKVVARDFDVAWLARFNNRVESLGGLVSADARLAGTVADPRFVGDVRWKNGAIVARGAGNVVAPDARDARVSATDQP
jgi:translocation and assembly module TamB